MSNQFGFLQIAVMGQIVLGGTSVDVFPVATAITMPVGIVLTNVSSVLVDIAMVKSEPRPDSNPIWPLARVDGLQPGESVMASVSFDLPPVGQTRSVVISGEMYSCPDVCNDPLGCNCPNIFFETVRLNIKPVTASGGGGNPPPGTVRETNNTALALLLGGVLLFPLVMERNRNRGR